MYKRQNLDTVRGVDRFTGWVTVPLAAVGLVGFTLLNNIGAAAGSDWLRAHQLTFAALGAAGLFAASATRDYLQQLPGGPVAVAPLSPLQGLRAPTDAAPGPALSKGRTGSAPYFTFAVAAGFASMAGVAALALLTAAEHRAGPIGYGLLVLAATAAPALGARLTRATLPSLSRRRLLALALLTQGVALILAGLVLDYVLVLLLTVLAGLAAGIVVSAGRTLLAQEVEEARLPKVTEHLFAVLRAVVAVALVVVPLIAAAYGDVEYGTVEPGSFTFIHGGAALAVATAGLLTLVLAAVCCCAPTTGAAPCPSAGTWSTRCAAPPDRCRTGARAPVSSSPWRAATAPASPPRLRRSPSGSAARATRSYSPGSPAAARSASGCAASSWTSATPACRTAPRR